MSVLVFRTVSSGRGKRLHEHTPDFESDVCTAHVNLKEATSMSFWGKMTSLCLKLYRVMISCVVICKHASMLMVQCEFDTLMFEEEKKALKEM